MKCPNCGATMNNGKCDYCGSDTNVSAIIEQQTGTLIFKGKEFKVYLSEIEYEPQIDVCRLSDNTLKRVNYGGIYKFTLVSY